MKGYVNGKVVDEVEFMQDEEPKIKNQKCKICEHCMVYDYGPGDTLYWCWNDDKLNPKQVEGTDRCHKWTWNGIDEK